MSKLSPSRRPPLPGHLCAMAWPGAALEEGDDHAAETPRGPPDDAGRCLENPGIFPGKFGLLQGKIMEKTMEKPWKIRGKTQTSCKLSLVMFVKKVGGLDHNKPL